MLEASNQKIHNQNNVRTGNLTTIAILATVLLAGANDAAAATLHVSQTSPNPTPPYDTWETAAHAIQEAVDATSDGDTVLVAAGEYRLTNQVSIARAILLRSDLGAEQTVLRGWGGRCLWVSNSLATVDGFTMWEGNGGPQGGGGVFLVGGTVQNCVIYRCYAWPDGPGGGVFMIGGVLRNSIVTAPFLPPLTANGGGVYCTGGGIIEDCEISDHRVGFNGGGVYLEDGQLRNSFVSANRAGSGGGVFARFSAISDCIITNNHAAAAGGGLYLDQCELDRSIIVGNRYAPASAGGTDVGQGAGVVGIDSTVRNSLIAANTTPFTADGGGIYLLGGSLLNCTVTENQSGGTGGGVYVEDGQVRNSIVFFNSAPAGANWRNADSGSFDYVCTIPHPGGVGNIVEDPQFVDPTNGNYRLQQTSPCVDAGINEEWMVGAFDLDGNPRIINGTVDLGAWEAPLMDTDGDGVPDRRDSCPNTAAGSVVNADGCSIAQLCPCEGPWSNHAEYVTCVREHAWAFYRADLITADQRQELLRTAAQSACGE